MVEDRFFCLILCHFAIDMSSMLEVNVNPVYFDKLSTRSLKR